jgi:hypothetical protein
MHDDPLSSRLRHVYWIGGGSGAGKSTIARRLADRHGLAVYATDDAMSDHAARCPDIEVPLLRAFQRMDMDERWVRRRPETMLDRFHWFEGEGFDRIVEDLLDLPPAPGIIVEGFRLLPHLVKPLLPTPSHGVWLIPTPEFRLAAFESRGTLWTIPRKTSDPERALRNLLARDRLFTERVRSDVESAGLPFITLDRSIAESDLVDRVAKQFGLRC